MKVVGHISQELIPGGYTLSVLAVYCTPWLMSMQKGVILTVFIKCVTVSKRFLLTTGMISAGNYNCLQGFQQLTSLTIEKGVPGNLADCCGLLDYLPHLEEISVYFSNNSNDAAVEVSAAETGTATCPNIRSMTLDGYNIFSPVLIQQNDTLLMQRFSNLQYLKITLPEGLNITRNYHLADSAMIAYIQQEIPSFDITMYTGEAADECQYLDLYCAGIQKKGGNDTTINNDN